MNDTTLRHQMINDRRIRYPFTVITPLFKELKIKPQNVEKQVNGSVFYMPMPSENRCYWMFESVIDKENFERLIEIKL